MAVQASIVEVEARFQDFVRIVESGDTVLVTRHGTPAVALVPLSEVAQLERLRAAGPDFESQELATGIAVRARLSFDGIPQETQRATLLELLGNGLAVQFRNVPLTRP